MAVLLLVGAPLFATGQQSKVWTLDECIAYARDNNISLKQSRVGWLSGQEDTRQAREAMFPSLSGSVSQNFSHLTSGENNYNGSYGLTSEVTLFAGGRLRNAYKQSLLGNSIDSLSMAETEIYIEMKIVQAYMQCLYAREAVTLNEQTAATSKAQRDRAEEMCKVGAISRVDLAQLESQYQNDVYQIVVAQNALEEYKLTLKQLLELDVLDEIEVEDIQQGDDDVVRILPSKADVFAAAKQRMPQMERSQKQVESAELGRRIAKAGFLPTVSLSGSIGTSNDNYSASSLGTQLSKNLAENVGLRVSIPIYSNGQNRTAVNKATYSYQDAILSQMETESSLLKEVESVYLDAKSAQSQFLAALTNRDYAQQSYELTFEQFKVGAKNTVELMTALNEYTQAAQSVIQAKYMAMLNCRLLDIYQGTEQREES